MVLARIAIVFALLSLVSTTAKARRRQSFFLLARPSVFKSPIWIASDLGFFKKHRLDANILYIPGGKTVVEGMLAGNIQMAIGAPGAVLRANLSGSDFAYVGALSNRADFVLFARDGIKSVQDLRGKKIAIGNVGSGTDYASRIVFEKLGMKVGRDVVFAQSLGGQPTRLAMLQSGTIDGAVLSPPFTLRAQQLGFHPVLDLASVIPHYFSLGHFTRRSYIRENGRVVENSLKALLDGTRYIVANADGTIKVLSCHLQISDEAFLRAYYRDVLLAQLDRDLYPDEKGVDLFLNQERATNPAAGKIKPGDFIDTSILDKLRKEGY